MLCATWMGGGLDTCICMAKCLHCSPETITTLLIGYTPIQNKKCLKRSLYQYCLTSGNKQKNSNNITLHLRQLEKEEETKPS